MKPIIKDLYVLNQVEYESNAFSESEYSILLAAKEPWHRKALGYSGRATAKDHPEYLYAFRDNKLILNLVDAPKSIFFNKDLIDLALEFIGDELNKGKKVIIACNQGESRSASLALLYLVKHGLIEGDTLEDVEAEYLRLYPRYNPGAGMRDFVKENWAYYSAPF